jgi:hypothetical protein
VPYIIAVVVFFVIDLIALIIALVMFFRDPRIRGS